MFTIQMLGMAQIGQVALFNNNDDDDDVIENSNE